MDPSNQPDVNPSLAQCSEMSRYLQAGRRVRSVVHDLNNHLGAIFSYSELLQTEVELNDEQKHYFHSILHAIQQSTELMNSFADIVQLKETRKVRSSLSAMLNDVLNLFHYDLKRHGISLKLNVDEDLPELRVDRPGLMQALAHLITNAIENVFNEPIKHIEMGLVADDKEVLFRVKDSGQTVPEPERIFESGYTTKLEGHPGWGLAEARKTARNHGGDIIYTPENEFVLRLPLKNE